MLEEAKIWRQAISLINRHGEDVLLVAVERADDLLAAGDLSGEATWRRIVGAIEELIRQRPADGEMVH